jgi:YHS domain-containing protein
VDVEKIRVLWHSNDNSTRKNKLQGKMIWLAMAMVRTRLLRRIAKEQERIVVIVSHDQRIKEIADRVLWLEDGQLKEMVTMATDPVCGMAIDMGTAVKAEWEGQLYYFCAKGCRDEFINRQSSS